MENTNHGSQRLLMLEAPSTVTDPDARQRCRILTDGDAHKTYEYEQDGPDGVINEVIDLDDYTLDDAFEKEYLAPYGYTLQSVIDTYGAAWEQIVAECIFETDNQ